RRHVTFYSCDDATADLYTLSLHDALPILERGARDRRRAVRLPQGPPVPHRRQALAAADDRRSRQAGRGHLRARAARRGARAVARDRKSTRLNSSHVKISYAVFCLKKKKNQ